MIASSALTVPRTTLRGVPPRRGRVLFVRGTHADAGGVHAGTGVVHAGAGGVEYVAGGVFPGAGGCVLGNLEMALRGRGCVLRTRRRIRRRLFQTFAGPQAASTGIFPD